MNTADRLLAALVWVLAVAAIAGVTHIAAILLLPPVAAKDVYAWIPELAKPAQLAVEPPAQPGKQLVPFADPAIVQAVCPFDLAQGGLRLHADVEGDRFLALSFHTPNGKLFYALTDLAAHEGRMDIVLLTAPQLEAVEADDDEDNPSQDLRLIAPASKGFVFVTALAYAPGERGEAERRVKSVACGLEPIAED
jgi:uncharacterized membrane protein